VKGGSRISIVERDRWQRTALEVVVIVGSILLAFSIDAMWSERQDRVEERAAIAQLTVDMHLNAARLDTARARHEDALAAANEILARSGLRGEAEGVLTAQQLVGRLLTTWTYEPAMGGVNSVLGSGRLDVLRSEALRVSLAGFPDRVDNLTEDEIYQREFVRDQLVPLLVDAASVPGVTPPAAFDRLLLDTRFLHTVAWRRIGLGVVLEDTEPVEQTLQELLALLEGA